jgi:putative hydrolase of the HAD superfamily
VGLVIGLDGDDTLWHNERLFSMTEERFRALLAPYVDGPELDRRLLETERRNLGLFGYGVKSFTLSMIETAIEVTGAQVPASLIAELLEAGKQMLAHPVELLDGVAETVPVLAARWPLILITKGDLFHQESKLARSGLLPHLGRVEIVSEKEPATYRRILAAAGVEADDFVMVGRLAPIRHRVGPGCRRARHPHPGIPGVGPRGGGDRPSRRWAVVAGALVPHPSPLAQHVGVQSVGAVPERQPSGRIGEGDLTARAVVAERAR